VTATRRLEIAQATARVIADEGLEHASLREIASSMGVTVGTLTHQFRDRDDLLRTTLEATAASIRARAMRSAEGKRGRALLMALQSEALPSDETRRVEAAVWLAFATSALSNESHAARYRQLYGEWEDGLTEIVEGMEDRASGDPRMAARLIIAATDGIALRALTAGGLPGAEQERMLSEAIAAIVGRDGS
jgi:AcrR family transcriptional regulator